MRNPDMKTYSKYKINTETGYKTKQNMQHHFGKNFYRDTHIQSGTYNIYQHAQF